MGTGERSDSDYRSNWRFKLVVGVGAGAGMAVAKLVGAGAEYFGYRPSPPWGLIGGLVMVVVGIGVGIALGRLVGRRLFGPRD